MIRSPSADRRLHELDRGIVEQVRHDTAEVFELGVRFRTRGEVLADRGHLGLLERPEDERAAPGRAPRRG